LDLSTLAYFFNTSTRENTTFVLFYEVTHPSKSFGTMKTTQKGNQAEDEACLYLINKGYEILERNYRFRRNEVDIIAKNDRFLVFLEVKFRTTNAFGFPESFVDENKIERMMQTAEHYIIKNNITTNIRFDILAIEKQNVITHFEDVH